MKSRYGVEGCAFRGGHQSTQCMSVGSPRLLVLIENNASLKVLLKREEGEENVLTSQFFLEHGSPNPLLLLFLPMQDPVGDDC